MLARTTLLIVQYDCKLALANTYVSTPHIHSVAFGQDLTFCYLHMAKGDLETLETLETPDYIKGEISDDGSYFIDKYILLGELIGNQRWTSPRTWCRRIQTILIVRATRRCYFHCLNTRNMQVLPSQVHPSYPYGNPTNPRHPAMKPRPLYDPMSKALFQDMGYDGGVTGALRWKDLALEELLPIDEAKEEAIRAEMARKMASGSASNQYQPQPAIPAQPTLEPTDIEDNDEDEDEADENEDEDEESEEDAEED
ncbi:hypothetical protein EYR38_007717 [Pleurotus pulmonarius]|nr:hypothetical protein EYR38_007717 [Pleurotus pulmonarius]